MNPERILEIEGRLEKATPGPWFAIHLDAIPTRDDGAFVSGPKIVYIDKMQAYTHGDADLIAYAPTDLRDLIAEVNRLREGNDRLTFALAKAEYPAKAAERAALAKTLFRPTPEAYVHVPEMGEEPKEGRHTPDRLPKKGDPCPKCRRSIVGHWRNLDPPFADRLVYELACPACGKVVSLSRQPPHATEEPTP